MAEQLIDALASDWDPKQYQDTYVDELKARIKAKDKDKGKSKDVVEAEPDEEKTRRRDRPRRGAATEPRQPAGAGSAPPAAPPQAA